MLVAEVSAYAAKNIDEVTAEMFRLWWCGPRPMSETVEVFGALVERYL